MRKSIDLKHEKAANPSYYLIRYWISAAETLFSQSQLHRIFGEYCLYGHRKIFYHTFSVPSFVFSFPSYCVPCVTLSPKLVFCQPHSVSHFLAFLHLPFLFPIPFPSVSILSEMRPLGKDTIPARGSSPVGPQKSCLIPYLWHILQDRLS